MGSSRWYHSIIEALGHSRPITSRQNAAVTRYRNVARGDDRSVVLLDGPHLISEALVAGLTVRHAMVVNEARPDIATLARRLEDRGIEVASVTARVIAAASPVRTPSGIVALADRPSGGDARLYRSVPLVIIASDVQDPGNVGAIVRVAEAAGASGVVAAGTCADPFGWKALRGSMGSALRLSIAFSRSVDEAVADARNHRCRVVAAVPKQGDSLFEADLTPPLAILVGGEGRGLPQALLDGVDRCVTVPMTPPVESLNVAVTAALILYEARRQSTTRSKKLKAES